MTPSADPSLDGQGVLIALIALVPNIVSFLGSWSALSSALPEHGDAPSRLGVQEMVRAVKHDLEALEDSSRQNAETPLFVGKEFDL